ncbi:hypothetical protein [Insolitispirillum peregrinum]|uniref:hypothetical protein n=1 Tax=Insolitispirillum peregrinum TaxID=80876 RepID=UPI0036154F16
MNSLKLSVLSLAVLVGLGACAAKPDWTRKGASDAEIEKDWNECRRLADQQTGVSRDDSRSGSSSGLAEYDRRQTASRNKAVVDACMRGRGYFPIR